MVAEQNSQGSFLWIKAIDKAEIPDRSPIWHLDRCWENFAHDGRLPARSDMDPIDIGSGALPWIMILDVLPSGDELDYRYRLLGTANVKLLGRNPTGKLASKVLGSEERSTIRDTLDETVRKKTPTYWHAALPHERNFPVSVYRAVYPLADDGVTVNMLIGAAIPEEVLL